MKALVRNQTRQTVLADAAEIADSSAKRRTGLLKHERLAPGEGLWIVPCESVHTFFMKFPIDLIYLDKQLKVLKVRNAVPAWRLSLCRSAHSVLELPAGRAAETGAMAGDTLSIDKLGETLRQPAVVLQNAAVHHHRQAGRFGAAGGLFVDHAFLHPDRLGAFADGRFHDFGHELGAPEDVDDVDRPGTESRSG